MRFFELDKKMEALFWELDPLMMLPRCEFENTHALGAFERNKKTGTDEPVGLLILRDEEDQVTIVWMCIAEEYRMQGKGDETLNYVIEYAKKKNIDNVRAYFIKDGLRENLSLSAKEYFKSHGFKEESEISGEWIFDIKALLKLGEEYSSEKEYFPMPLSAFNDEILEEIIEGISKNPNTFSLYDPKEALKKADPQLSFILANEEGHISAALFLQKEDILYPTILLADSPDEGKAVMALSAEACFSKYGRDILVNVILKNQDYAAFINYLFPGRIKPTSYLSLSVKEFEAPENYDLSHERVYRNLNLEEERKPEKKSIEGLLLEGEEVAITLKQISKAFGRADEKTLKMVKSFNELNLRDLQSVLLNLNYSQNYGALDNKASGFDLDMIENDISCFFKRGDDINCMILFHKNEKQELIPILLYLDRKESRQLAGYLFLYAYSVAKDKYPEDTKIVIRCHNDIVKDLCNKILRMCNK